MKLDIANPCVCTIDFWLIWCTDYIVTLDKLLYVCVWYSKVYRYVACESIGPDFMAL